jgi:hypothetical protein
MKIIESLNKKEMRVNESIGSNLNDGVAISLTYDNGYLYNQHFCIEKTTKIDYFTPSEKLFILQLTGHQEIKDIEQFVKTLMPLLIGHPNFILQHFSVESIQKVKKYLKYLPSPLSINISTQLPSYHSDNDIDSFHLDYETYPLENCNIEKMIDRLQKDKKIVIDLATWNDFSYNELINLFELAKLSKKDNEIHIITEYPRLIRNIGK